MVVSTSSTTARGYAQGLVEIYAIQMSAWQIYSKTMPLLAQVGWLRGGREIYSKTVIPALDAGIYIAKYYRLSRIALATRMVNPDNDSFKI